MKRADDIQLGLVMIGHVVHFADKNNGNLPEVIDHPIEADDLSVAHPENLILALPGFRQDQCKKQKQGEKKQSRFSHVMDSCRDFLLFYRDGRSFSGIRSCRSGDGKGAEVSRGGVWFGGALRFIDPSRWSLS
jgi:hypothetical protein